VKTPGPQGACAGFLRVKTQGYQVKGNGEATGDPQAKGYLPASSGKEADFAAGKNPQREEAKEKVSHSENCWSAKDRERIAAEGLTVGEVERQLSLFRRGVSLVRLNRPCLRGDGIVVLGATEEQDQLKVYNEALRTKRFIKFVPASGAASRMFKEWYRYLSEGGFPEKTQEDAFISDLKRHCFFPDLRAIIASHRQDLDRLIKKQDGATILKYILTEDGLNYGRLPKALLKFHAYPEGSRTPLEEHLVEAASYARDGQNCSRLHLTVSSEHQDAVRVYLQQVLGSYESRLHTVLEVGLSIQSTGTNTLAVDPEKRPFRDARGELVFRPGGHGSLLMNLNALEADIIFLKNIDNCVPDRLKPETVRWKKILAGCLIALQDAIFRRLRLLSTGKAGEADISEITGFCGKKLNIVMPPGFLRRSLADRRSFLFEKLNRPIRVCGMVKNQGEPGGGPFWVDHSDRTAASSPQVVEETQIDRNDSGQRTLWGSSAYFNPVDLVCGIRDFRGKKFDLTRFVDPDWSTISVKSEEGRELLALERPGLWNGSMAFWNTTFVEVPLITFNPVKTVADLLRPQHLPE
jgi:hypothetical protein